MHVTGAVGAVGKAQRASLKAAAEKWLANGDELVGAAAVAQPVQPHHEATGPRGGRALLLRLPRSVEEFGWF